MHCFLWTQKEQNKGKRRTMIFILFLFKEEGNKQNKETMHGFNVWKGGTEIISKKCIMDNGRNGGNKINRIKGNSKQ